MIRPVDVLVWIVKSRVLVVQHGNLVVHVCCCNCRCLRLPLLVVVVVAMCFSTSALVTVLNTPTQY